jgi:hypothetical protein
MIRLTSSVPVWIGLLPSWQLEESWAVPPSHKTIAKARTTSLLHKSKEQAKEGRGEKKNQFSGGVAFIIIIQIHKMVFGSVGMRNTKRITLIFQCLSLWNKKWQSTADFWFQRCKHWDGICPAWWSMMKMLG